MNERIKELIGQMDQSGIPHQAGDNSMTVTDRDLEYFAELIIRECIETIVRDTANYQGEGMMAYYQGVQNAGKSIKQHFGVEE